MKNTNEIAHNNTTEQKLSDTEISGGITAANPDSSSQSSDAFSEDSSPASIQPAKLPSPGISANIATSQPLSITPVTNTTTSYLEPSRNISSPSTTALGGNPHSTSIIHAGLINYSEFEREPDPFEKAELQTLNNMQELAAVFPQSSIKTNNSYVPNMSNATLGIDQRYMMQSQNSSGGITTGNQQQTASSQINQGNFHYSQPQASVSTVTTTIPGPFYQQTNITSAAHLQTLGHFYPQGNLKTKGIYSAPSRLIISVTSMKLTMACIYISRYQ